jgi:crotonobetainyl-CoA:carnitine CoA-transferase CaiB-like acyl-CoA transferase
VLGEPDVAVDARFADPDARRQNRRSCIEWLEGVFSTKRFDEWLEVLSAFEGEWVPVSLPGELPADPQVAANGYLSSVDIGNGARLPLVPTPVQFDGRRTEPARGPEHGEHTESVLLGLGLSWDEILALKESGAVL